MLPSLAPTSNSPPFGDFCVVVYKEGKGTREIKESYLSFNLILEGVGEATNLFTWAKIRVHGENHLIASQNQITFNKQKESPKEI